LGAFRRRVLEKAHKDICASTGLNFEWEPVKRGNAVVAVRFVFGGKKRSLLQKEKAATTQTKQTAASNRLFRAAVECAEAKGRVCAEQSNKPKVCEVCRRLEMVKI